MQEVLSYEEFWIVIDEKKWILEDHVKDRLPKEVLMEVKQASGLNPCSWYGFSNTGAW